MHFLFLVALSFISATGCHPVNRSSQKAVQSIIGAKFLSLSTQGTLCPEGSFAASYHKDLPFPLTALNRTGKLTQKSPGNCIMGFTFAIPEGYRMQAPPWIFNGGISTSSLPTASESTSFVASFALSRQGDAKIVRGSRTSATEGAHWKIAVEASEQLQTPCSLSKPGNVTWIVDLQLNFVNSENRFAVIDSIDASHEKGGDLFQYSACKE